MKTLAVYVLMPLISLAALFVLVEAYLGHDVPLPIWIGALIALVSASMILLRHAILNDPTRRKVPMHGPHEYDGLFRSRRS